MLSNASQEEREAASRVFPAPPTRGISSGRAILERRIVHIHDVRDDPEYTAAPIQSATLGYRTVLAVPLLRDGEPIGALVMWRREVRPFSQKQIDLMTTFADQAVIAIENVRLFTELEVKNRDLTEALEQQTATGEILRVISSSPTDVQPVFDAIARQLAPAVSCRHVRRLPLRREPDPPHRSQRLRAGCCRGDAAAVPRPPSRDLSTARSIVDRMVIHIADVRADPAYRGQEWATVTGLRSVLSVPMLREGHPIGVITVIAAEAKPFSAGRSRC